MGVVRGEWKRTTHNMKLLLKILIALSLIAFLLLNNFWCLFYDSPFPCLSSGFGGQESELIYYGEIALGLILLVILLLKSLSKSVFYITYLLFTITVFLPTFIERVYAHNNNSLDLIHAFYLIVFLAFWTWFIFKRKDVWLKMTK